MSELDNEKYYSKWTQHAAFNVGNMAIWFINAAFTTWVVQYYYVAMKMEMTKIMIAFTLWTIWNAINDPLLGFISDRTRSKMGRRKPYIIAGLIPVAIIEVILWLPPVKTSIINPQPWFRDPLFWYLMIMLLAYDTFYTMIALPYDSLFPEMYLTEKQRASSNTWKQILSTIGLLLAFILPGYLIGDHLWNKKGYVINGIVTSALLVIMIVISLIWGVKERKEFSLDYKHEFGFFKGLGYTFKNKGFVLYTLMYFFFEYVLLTLGAVIPLFGEQILGSTPFMSSLLSGALFIIGILSVPLWKQLHVKIGSKISFGISLILYVATSIPLLFVTDYWYALYTSIAMGVGFGGMMYFIYLLISDVCDEDELKTGKRREGAFFGITNFFMRLSMIVSIISIGLVFNRTGWDTWTPAPGVNVITGLRILVFGFPAAALGLVLLCLIFYPLSKKRVEEMKIQLNEIHNQKKEKVQHQHTE